MVYQIQSLSQACQGHDHYNPHISLGGNISFSVLTVGHGSVQKRIVPDSDGRPVKDGKHHLGITTGIVERCTVAGPQAFADTLAGLGDDQALTLGVTDWQRRNIVSKEKLAATVGVDAISRSLDYFDWHKDGYFPLLLDYDPEPGQPSITWQQLWERFTQVMPEFAGAAHVVTVSTSSAIYDKTTGECLKPAAGFHLYIFVRGDVVRFASILKARFWLAGEAFYKLSSPNAQHGTQSALERCLVDCTVFSPERLVYEAGAKIPSSAPFEQRRPAPTVVDGGFIDLDHIEALTKAQITDSEHIKATAKAQITGQAIDATAKRIREKSPALSETEARKVAKRLTQQAERGILAPDHILYLQGGGTLKAGEIGPQHNRLKLQDPAEPDYRGGEYCGMIFCESPGQWTIKSYAHGGKVYRLQGVKSVARADSTKALNRKQNIQQSMAILKASVPKADISTEGGFIQLPEGWDALAVDAGMAAGKTTAMVKAIKEWWAGIRGYSLVLTSRISLGKQTAIAASIPHSGDLGIGGDFDDLIGIQARQNGGLVSQVNSLPRLARQIPTEHLMLLLDEAMATLSEAASGGTLGRQKFSLAWEFLFSLMRSSQRILLSEANINAATINLVQEITGRKIAVIRHKTNGERFPLNMVSTASGFKDLLLDALAIHPLKSYTTVDRFKNVMVCTTSKAFADQLEVIAIKGGIKPEEILKITGDTNEAGAFDGFWEDPKSFLATHKPRLLIVTQTAQTGLSIEGDHFDVVFGYGPGFKPSVLWQMLGRYRKPVPRYVWIPPYIQPERHEKPTREQAMVAANRDVSRWCGQGFSPDADSDQAILNRYIADNNAQAWAEKIAPREALRWMAEQGGHSAQSIDSKLETEEFEAIQGLWNDAKEALALAHSKHHARALLDPTQHTDEWARKARQRETTYAERVLLRKYDCLNAFPGIDWDSPEIWYQAIFKPRQHDEGEVVSGPLAPGARLWAECGAADLFEAMDRNEAGLVFAKRLVSASIMPTHSVRVGILAPMQPLCEQLADKGSARPDCPIVQRLAAMARAVGNDLNDYLRITATDDQSDVAIACKILRKFALTVTRENQRTIAGKRVWLYSVEVPELWQALVEARRKSLEALRDSRLGNCTKFVESSCNKFGAGGAVDPAAPTHRWPLMGIEGWIDRIEGGVNAVFRALSGAVFTTFVGNLEAIA